MREDGFTLIEIVAALAILALVAGLALPTLRPGATPGDVDAQAMRIATLLKQLRLAAINQGAATAALVDVRHGAVIAGEGRASVQAPADIALGARVTQRCAGSPSGASIAFFPSGQSCGGVIYLEGARRRAEVRVNWLTGGVEIVATDRR